MISKNTQWQKKIMPSDSKKKEQLNSFLPDKSIDFLGLDVIHFLDCILDLSLVSTNVNDENKGVVIFNLLHCRFSGEGIFQNLVMIKFIP